MQAPRRSVSLLLLAALASISASPSTSTSSSPYIILDPTSFQPYLQEDFDWASSSIPFFESSDTNLTLTYYFRWRVFKSHVHSTGDSTYPWVITEFAPNVPWAGSNNTIPCAAGHHIAEAKWLRDTSIVNSYINWWPSHLPGIKQNYYYWLAHGLLDTLQVTGLAGSSTSPSSSSSSSGLQNISPDLLANMTQLALSYFVGVLPDNGGTAFDTVNDCVWNEPGNEGQENSISGDGCRPLVQALLYGEASALSTLCALLGNTSCATQFQLQADHFQQRVLNLWNTNISFFDTWRSPRPAPPPSPPPPMPSNYALFTNASIFCCDQAPCENGRSKFLYEGSQYPETCAAMCDNYTGGICHYVTTSPQSSNWCQLAEYCNTTNPFAGAQAFTFVRTSSSLSSSSALTSMSTSTSSASSPPFANVRELASLSSPWFFNAIPLANASVYSIAFETLFDAEGLGGEYGLRTAEARNPGYNCHKASCCFWDGPSWPFETSKVLTAGIRILQDTAGFAPQVPALNRSNVYTLLEQYTRMHNGDAWKITDSDGNLANYSALNASGLFFDGLGDMWFAEAGCADDSTWTDNPYEGYKYLHSSYIDLILRGIVGLMPNVLGLDVEEGKGGRRKRTEVTPPLPTLSILPLQPDDTTLRWWCIDGLLINGQNVTVFWDIDGTRYNNGRGLQVYVNGIFTTSSQTTQGPALVVNV